LNPRILLCICLIVGVLFATISGSNVAAQSCKKVDVASNYPKQAEPNQQIQVTTTIIGSCTSGPEDYFSVRVDLTDGVSKALLSTESTPIGYSVSNFTVTVQNSATTPTGNRTWPIVIDTYLTIDGTQSHLNSTTAMIQVGSTAVPEFHASPSLVLLLALAVTLGVYLRKLHKPQNL
jgi:hypothetical protein